MSTPYTCCGAALQASGSRGGRSAFGVRQAAKNYAVRPTGCEHETRGWRETCRNPSTGSGGTR